MPVSHEAHSFVCKFGGWLFLTGLICLVIGEGVLPLIAGVLTTLFLASLVGRISRVTKKG
jgi:hypothetical protein